MTTLSEDTDGMAVGLYKRAKRACYQKARSNNKMHLSPVSIALMYAVELLALAGSMGGDRGLAPPARAA